MDLCVNSFFVVVLQCTLNPTLRRFYACAVGGWELLDLVEY